MKVLLAPIKLFVFKKQMRAIWRSEVINSCCGGFAVDFNHPVVFIYGSSRNVTNRHYTSAPRRHFDSELVARMLLYGHCQYVMRVCALQYVDACAGRRGFSFWVLVYFKLQLHTNVYHLRIKEITLVKIIVIGNVVYMNISHSDQ